MYYIYDYDRSLSAIKSIINTSLPADKYNLKVNTMANSFVFSFSFSNKHSIQYRIRPCGMLKVVSNIIVDYCEPNDRQRINELEAMVSAGLVATKPEWLTDTELIYKLTWILSLAGMPNKLLETHVIAAMEALTKYCVKLKVPEEGIVILKSEATVNILALLVDLITEPSNAHPDLSVDKLVITPTLYEEVNKARDTVLFTVDLHYYPSSDGDHGAYAHKRHGTTSLLIWELIENAVNYSVHALRAVTYSDYHDDISVKDTLSSHERP